MIDVIDREVWLQTQHADLGAIQSWTAGLEALGTDPHEVPEFYVDGDQVVGARRYLTQDGRRYLDDSGAVATELIGRSS